VLLTPVRAPKANVYAERWVRTVRAECLDWLLLVGRGHLERALRFCVQHDNGHRPHRALGLQAPDQPAGLTVVGEFRRGRVHRRRSAARVPASCMNAFAHLQGATPPATRPRLTTHTHNSLSARL
jgi:hypothetical protein